MKIFNKKINLFIALALLLLINPVKVFAVNDLTGLHGDQLKDVRSCNNDGTCHLVCAYTNEVPELTITMTYETYVYYSMDTKEFFIEWSTRNEGMKSADLNSNLIFESSYARNKLLKGECPKNAFVDNSGWESELCFDDNSSDTQGYCVKDKPGGVGTKFTGISSLDYSMINGLNPWFDKWAYDIDCIGFVGLTSEQQTAKINNEMISDWYNYSKDKKFPSFLEDIVNIKIKEGLTETKLQDLKNKCESVYTEEVNNENMTEQEKQETMNNLNNVSNDDVVNNFIEDFRENLEEKPKYTGPRYCGIFGEETWKIIKSLYGIVKVLIPVLVVILGMIDFATVVFSGEDKDMKTAGQRFIKRIIVGVVLLLLPAILGFIFNLVGFSEGCLAELMK